MNKYETNTFSTNTSKCKDISITEDAIKQILFLINLNSENIGIRLSIKKSGCAGFRYTMNLVTAEEFQKEKNDKEINFLYKSIRIYILYKDIPFLEGVKIDFVQNNINKVFKFYNSKLDQFCGCGESFSID